MPDDQTTGFVYLPLQFVKVTAFDLGYPGRVTQCVLRPHGRMLYEVEYAADGELKVREFEADQLKAAA